MVRSSTEDDTAAPVLRHLHSCYAVHLALTIVQMPVYVQDLYPLRCALLLVPRRDKGTSSGQGR